LDIEDFHKFVLLLGDLYLRIEQWEKAEQAFSKLVKVIKKNSAMMETASYSHFLDKLLTVKIKLKKYDDAETLCETFTRLPGILNGNPLLYHRTLIHLGRINLLQGKVDKSRTVYDSLVKLLDTAENSTGGVGGSILMQHQQQRLVEILSQLSAVNYEAGWLEQAEHWLKTLLNRFPSATQATLIARNQLANLYWQRREDASADELYRTIRSTPHLEKLPFLRTTSRYFTTQDAGFIWNLEENLASFFIKLSIRELNLKQQLSADPNFKPLAPGFSIHAYFQNPVTSNHRENVKIHQHKLENHNSEEHKLENHDSEEELEKIKENEEVENMTAKQTQLRNEEDDDKKEEEEEEGKFIIVKQELSVEVLKQREISIQSPSFAILHKKPYHVRILVYSSDMNDQVSSHHDFIVSRLNTTNLTTPELHQLFPLSF